MPRLAKSAGSFRPSSAPFARNVCWNRLPWPVGRGAPSLSFLPGRRPPRSFEYDAGARARGLYVDLGNRGSIVAHCAAIRHNAGGQLSPAVQSAFEARLDGEFWRFWRGSNIDAFASPVQCAKGPPGLRDACIVGATFQRPLFVRLLCQNRGRTATTANESATCRLPVAENATDATNPRAHCPILPAGRYRKPPRSKRLAQTPDKKGCR